eukprot:2197081-Pyramimonas_sp.AAC.1
MRPRTRRGRQSGGAGREGRRSQPERFDPKSAARPKRGGAGGKAARRERIRDEESHITTTMNPTSPLGGCGWA